MNARTQVATILGLLVWLTAVPAVAQTKWEIGFKGGVGLGKLTGDTGFNESFTDGIDTITLSGDISDSRTGFAGGGFATAQFTDAFGIRLEMLYAQKGGKGAVNVAVNSTPAGSADATFKMDYFEIPILAVGSFAAGNAARADVFGGPTIAFNTGAKVKVEASGQSQEEDNSDVTEGTDFGFAAGAGLRFAATPTVSVVLDGRYTFGLTKVPKDGTDIKNGCLAFMAGLSFPLGVAGAP